MNCQKCRTPLRLDGSLEDLNPASFKILADSAQQQNPKVSRPSRPAYSQDERERYNRASQNAQSPVFKRSIPSAHTRKERAKDNPAAMSYVLLTDSQVTPRPEAQATIPKSPRKGRRRSVGTKTGDVDDNTLLSHKMETTAHLFEILSSRSDIDHPICVECTEILVEGLQKRLATASKERDAYVEFLKEANNDIPTEEERQQAQNDLAIVHEREQKAFQELE
ncbi:Vacuolar protein sorting-associated protein atg6, partial [Cryomyces antarcticus]